MKKITIIFSILFSSTFISCEKFTNTLPEDFISPETYFRTETELNTALVGVYDVLGQRGLYGRNLILELGLATDEGFCRASTGVIPYFYNNDTSDSYILNSWTNLYQGIERANLLLKNIDKANASTEVKDAIRGQALFLKAYYYFILVSHWGEVPLKLEPAGSLSETSFKKSTAKDIYERIIADMTTAEVLVKDITKTGSGRVSKSAIQGILAKVCLHAAGRISNQTTDYTLSLYKLSLQWSEKLITTNIHYLNPDYTQVFINYLQDKYDIHESIWEVEFLGNGIGTPYNETENFASAFGVLNSDENPVGYSYGLILSTAKFYNAYGVNDKRRDWNISPFTYSGNKGTVKSNYPSTNKWRYIGKYRRELQVLSPKNKNYGPTNFPLLRYADVLLMYAEANNFVNKGPNIASYKAINQVRRRAVGADINTINPSVDLAVNLNEVDFLTELKNERFRELAFEGIRKLDLIRWGDFLKVMSDEVSDVNTNGVTSGPAWPGKVIVASRYEAVSERNLLLPIPQAELSLNSGFGGQNPKW